ncbi:MAG: DUF5683 domain-containing protein [Saprospiraceae bacterium]|nr:DUF5683 domain-containing protein [Saprospiraceae bacterium]
MTKYFIIGLFFIGLGNSAFAQNIPTIPEDRNSNVEAINDVPDSSKIVDNTFFDIFSGKPGRAAFYGLIIPGGGQIYNKRWWKLPFVYGLEGWLIYNIINTNSRYNEYDNAYRMNLAGGEVFVDGTSDIGIIRTRRASLRQSREYSWVFFLGGHIITIFEAFIDRHLIEFDVSDDLTFTPISTDLGLVNGITYTIPLNKKKTYTFKNLLQ